jgi:hypothetical protein
METTCWPSMAIVRPTATATRRTALPEGDLAACRPVHRTPRMSSSKKWPALKRTVPTYPPLYVSIARVVPTFFIMGACIELFMQKVPIGGRTFYDVALDKEVRRPLPRRRHARLAHRPSSIGSCLTKRVASACSFAGRATLPG